MRKRGVFRRDGEAMVAMGEEEGKEGEKREAEQSPGEL